MVAIIFPFLYFVLTLLRIDSGRMKIVQMLCISIFMSWSRHIFFAYRLQKLLGFDWFKKNLLELFILYLYLFFFHKMMKFYTAISSAWNFFSHKNTIEIYLNYWNVLPWIFPDCLSFDRNPTEFYTSF